MPTQGDKTTMNRNKNDYKRQGCSVPLSVWVSCTQYVGGIAGLLQLRTHCLINHPQSSHTVKRGCRKKQKRPKILMFLLLCPETVHTIRSYLKQLNFLSSLTPNQPELAVKFRYIDFVQASVRFLLHLQQQYKELIELCCLVSIKQLHSLNSKHEIQRNLHLLLNCLSSAQHLSCNICYNPSFNPHNMCPGS